MWFGNYRILPTLSSSLYLSLSLYIYIIYIYIYIYNRDHDHDKYVTTQKVNKLTAGNSSARLKQANLSSKNVIAHEHVTVNRDVLDLI